MTVTSGICIFLTELFQPVLYNPFRSGRNEQKISYRHANWYESPLCSTSAKISACSGRSDLFRPVSVGKLVSAGILFGPLVFIYFFSFLSQSALSLFYSKTFVGFGFWWWWEEELSFGFIESEKFGLKVEEVGEACVWELLAEPFPFFYKAIVRILFLFLSSCCFWGCDIVTCEFVWVML